MNARGVAVVLALCLFSSHTSATYAADGWWPGWPSGKATSTASSRKNSNTSWLPWSASKPKSKAHKPSTFDKMARSTKSAWNKTVDFINPFDDKPAAKTTPGSVPNTNGWFNSTKPTDKPSSVPEWMSGQRPTF